MMQVPSSTSNDQSRRVTVVGSCLSALLPEDLDLFFKQGVLIDRRNGTPMEMDAYSLYLALIAVERTSGRDLHRERKRLVDAVLDRFRSNGGFWTHGAWTNSEAEVHLRFTAAAIRLLVEAFDEGLLPNAQPAIDALRRHLSYSEAMPVGLWFFHDSLELPGVSDYHRKPNRRRAWGASIENCLVLNTHIDTLVTLLDFIARVRLQNADRQFFVDQANAGLRTLEEVLSPNLLGSWQVLDQFDSLVRAIVFRSFASRSRLIAKFRRLMEKTYFRARLEFKRRYPRFALADGYLERDIGLPGTAFIYHITNIYDLARLALQLENTDFCGRDALVQRCHVLVDRGLDYATGPAYMHYLRSTSRGEGIVLCDALLARLGAMSDRPIPQDWVSAYCEIRRRLPRSAAILGYDPLIVQPIPSGAHVENDADTGILHNNTKFRFDLIGDRLVLEPADAVAGNDRRELRP